MKNKKKGIVVAGHEATADIAVDIMKEGGNAYDAAVAAMLVAFNAEPCMCSPGGGGFANIFTKEGHSEVLDFFCQTPRKKLLAGESDFFPFTINFGGAKEDFYIGHGSHAVPGILAGCFQIHESYGRIPMNRLVEPVLETIKGGVEVDPFQYMDIVFLNEMMQHDPRALEIYFDEKNRPLQVGRKIVMDALPDFIDAIGREGVRLFYEGEPARKICRDGKEKGGNLDLEDFKTYKVNRRSPIAITHKNRKILTPHFPSLGGAIIALGFGELNAMTKKGIPNFKTHVEDLLPVLKKMERTNRNPENLFPELGFYENIMLNKKWGSTTHFGILDGEGNAVSVTVSNGEGSGYIIPGTDCFMNNMLGEAALLPNGYFSWKENTRLYSLMSPTIVVHPEKGVDIITGTGGAGRIPGAVFQVLHYLMDYGWKVEKAVHAPRMHLNGNTLNLEPGFDSIPSNIDTEISEWKESHMFFGGVHTITLNNGELDGIGDERRYGVVKLVE